MSLLDIRNLHTYLNTGGDTVKAVDGVTFALNGAGIWSLVVLNAWLEKNNICTYCAITDQQCLFLLIGLVFVPLNRYNGNAITTQISKLQLHLRPNMTRICIAEFGFKKHNMS